MSAIACTKHVTVLRTFSVFIRSMIKLRLEGAGSKQICKCYQSGQLLSAGSQVFDMAQGGTSLDRTTQKISRRHYWSFRSECRTLR
jgi:hypothetical protein